jgi:ectoine hydroxylase-related dioxygenase (phytanoyl-CoA dioxygenase family)
MKEMLTSSQIAQYERDGFLVLRAQFDEAEIESFDRAYKRQPPDSSLPAGKTYPEPGRYTLAHSCMADPDLAAIAEHPSVLGPTQTLLGDDPVLTAFVVYDRTPEGPGLPKHHDYKRWRPVGSSMNWLFTIVPFTDYDDEIGPFYVSPGSHMPERVSDRGERTLHVDPARVPDDGSFIDPELRRGDLLLMNMHCWHKADANHSSRPRAGFFNKYAAKHCPPATGYYLFNDAAHAALSEGGQKVMAVHSDKAIATTRMLLERKGKDGPEYLLVKDKNGGWRFPGGPTWQEQAIPDWDIGNYIASLHTVLREELRIETPWASYVGDYDEGDGLCRLYAYELNQNGFPVPYRGEWLGLDDVRSAQLAHGYAPTAIETWKDPAIVRGKGLTQAQSRIDQFAY